MEAAWIVVLAVLAIARSEQAPCAFETAVVVQRTGIELSILSTPPMPSRYPRVFLRCLACLAVFLAAYRHYLLLRRVLLCPYPFKKSGSFSRCQPREGDLDLRLGENLLQLLLNRRFGRFQRHAAHLNAAVRRAKRHGSGGSTL